MHLTGQQSVNKRDMKQLTIENFKAMLDNALKNIKEREDEFSKLDAVIGDGHVRYRGYGPERNGVQNHAERYGF